MADSHLATHQIIKECQGLLIHMIKGRDIYIAEIDLVIMNWTFIASNYFKCMQI